MKRLLLYFSIVLLAVSCSINSSLTPADSFTSPDGRLKMNFYLSHKGEPLYSLTFDGREIIQPSKLGLDIRHQGGVNNLQIFKPITMEPPLGNYNGNGAGIKATDGGTLNGSSLKDCFRIEKVEKNTFDQTWKPIWGEVSSIRDNHNEMAVTLVQRLSDIGIANTNNENEGASISAPQEREIVIRFRLFNDGLGFRYEFPKQKNLGYFFISQEITEFTMAEDLTAFWIAGDYDSNEYLYEKSKISEIPEKYDSFDRSGNSCVYPMPVPGVQTPVMMMSEPAENEYDSQDTTAQERIFVNIHEAALNNYPSMQLEVTGAKFTAHLVPDAIGNRGYIQTPQNTPWRTVIVTDNAPAILESKLILNLNEPCAIGYDETTGEGEAAQWIKPQKFIGVWWEMFLPNYGTWCYSDDNNVKLGVTDFAKLTPNGRHAANTENVKKYIDFASENGIDGVLVEGWDIGWENWTGVFKEYVFDFMTPYPDFDVVQLREYAKSKGVQLVMHHETSGSAANYERYLDRAYQFMKDNNYSVVKSGYVGPIIPRGEHHYGQTMVNHYIHCLKRAADYQIMVDAHEPVRPTGMHRTYPNFLAAESGRGTEFETFFEKGNSPEHTTIMPFTRIMGGPMDYTPGIFEQKMSHYGDGTSPSRVHTTLVKQLALYVTMYSPLQMVADLPDNYRRFPDAFQFIKDVAIDWDDTKVLEAEPGDYITTARKAKGLNEWYIGGITDENPRTATIDLSKIGLNPDTKYIATIYADGDDAHWDTAPQSYKIYSQEVTSETILQIPLAPGGGVAIAMK